MDVFREIIMIIIVSW